MFQCEILGPFMLLLLPCHWTQDKGPGPAQGGCIGGCGVGVGGCDGGVGGCDGGVGWGGAGAGGC